MTTNKKASQQAKEKLAWKRPRCEDEETTVTATTTRLPNGTLLRVLPPYLYTFASFAKGRWVGQTILDVYSSEFGSYPESYYKAAIETGRISVYGEKVSTDYKIQRRDELNHTVHRHEPAVVVSSEIAPFFTIVGETEEVVAVDKPSAIPVHPCGGYSKNSLMQILEDETRFGKLYTIHRLDRLTSGLLVMAKSSNVAKKWAKAITDRTCEKIYLARVKGRFGANFPKDIPLLNGPSFPDHGEWVENRVEDSPLNAQSARKVHAYGRWVTNSQGEAIGSEQSWPEIEHTIDELLESLDRPNKAKMPKWLTLSCPVRIENRKDGICASGVFSEVEDADYLKTVKAAQTSFAVVHFFEDSTLIMARPMTGRTHQIRLHLQHLGHSIANDPHYGGDMWFGNDQGKELSEKAHLALGQNTLLTSDTPATEAEVCNTTATGSLSNESLEQIVKRTCVWCSRLGSLTAEERSVQEFQVRCQGLWLHALRYRISKEAVFQTNAPKWAAER